MIKYTTNNARYYVSNAKYTSAMQNAYQFLGTIIIVIQKIINYSIIYIFLVDLKFGLYPYSDINDSFHSNIISSNAVFSKLSLSFIGLISGSLFLLFLFCIYKLNILKISKIFLILLLFVSTIEIAWLSSSFLKLRSISYLVGNCEFANQVQVGCYIPPEKI